MVKIRRADRTDLELLLALGRTTFLEAHGSSGSEQDLDNYLNSVYTPSTFLKEFDDANTHFFLISVDQKPAGFSKITLNVNCSNSKSERLTKLDRIYVLKEYYDKKLGLELLNFNIKLSKKLNQTGMWLYVWVENHRAVNFYQKTGFNTIGKHDFRLSNTHTNPNHVMLLEY